MNLDANLALKTFFAIPRETIARDLRECPGRVSGIRQEWERLLTIPSEQRTPETFTKSAHLGMLLAYELAQRPELPLELKIFNVAFHANTVVQAVDMDALRKGSLAEIRAKLEEIKKREGLSPDESWPLGEGPADYQALDNEALQIAEGISDTVFVEILRRYLLDEEADLFENDRKQFDILNDTARRAMSLFDNLPVEILARMDQMFADQHGEPALRTMRARVAELKVLLQRK